MGAMPAEPLGVGDPIDVWLAGQKAPAGAYRDIESGREVEIEEGGVLPAGCDGRVAAYRRRPTTWAELRHHRKDQAA